MKRRKLTPEEHEMALAALRFLGWVRRNRINVIVLKGTGAAPLRALLTETWKSMGFSNEQFPKLYSLGKLSPAPPMTPKAEIPWIERGLKEKLGKDYQGLNRLLQNEGTNVAIVDEVISSGLSLKTVKEYFRAHGRARIGSAAIASEGLARAENRPDFLASHSLTVKNYLQGFAAAREVLARREIYAPFPPNKIRTKMREFGKAARLLTRSKNKPRPK